MSPGAFARQGDGLTDPHYGWFDSPFGTALAMGTERGLCGLAFAEESGATRPWPTCAPAGPRRLHRGGRRIAPGSRRPSPGAARRGCR